MRMNKYLEKIAGNRLVRHIAENRENFPLSRLLGLAEKGVLKTPEQLLPGRNLGVVNQFTDIAQKYGLKPKQGVAIPAFPRMGVAIADRGVSVGGGYTSTVGFRGDASRPFAEVRVPPLYNPVPGNHAENIKRISDTHTNNHETFEMDEALRTLKKTGLLGDGYNVKSHNNPAVLLRESRDMSSNPYSHIIPPAPKKDDYFKFVEDVRSKRLDLGEEILKRRILPVDPSADITRYRRKSGEADFITRLQNGRPYQSNPTSSEIRRSREVPAAESAAFFENRPKPGFFGRVKDDLQEVYDIKKGNSAFRN